MRFAPSALEDWLRDCYFDASVDLDPNRYKKLILV